jgi:hypothetical protein
VKAGLLCVPQGLAVVGDTLMVADTYNDRVVAYQRDG